MKDLATLITGILPERSIEIAATKPGLEIVTPIGPDAYYRFLIDHCETASTFPLTVPTCLPANFSDAKSRFLPAQCASSATGH